MFKMLYDSNFTYDSSMPVYENRPPSWPYTLDYKIFHDCMIPPCPTRSYPGKHHTVVELYVFERAPRKVSSWGLLGQYICIGDVAGLG